MLRLLRHYSVTLRRLLHTILWILLALTVEAEGLSPPSVLISPAQLVTLPVPQCTAPSINPPATMPPSTTRSSEIAGAEKPFSISSNSGVLHLNGNATLNGNVNLTHGDRQLSAKDVQYDESTRTFKLDGAVNYQDPVVRLHASSGRYDSVSGGSFSEAEFELPERPARGAANQISLNTEGHLLLSKVWFSTCAATNPDWRLRASTLDLDTRTQQGNGRDATVEFLGVPILYLPYISFPLGTQRKSGFLFPGFGHTTRSGWQLTLPYYLNLAPNYDLLLQPTQYHERGVNLDGELRYLTDKHKGSVRLDFLQSDSQTQSNRNWLRFNHRSELPSGWRLDLNAQSVSDSDYFEDFSNSQYGASAVFLQRVAQLTYRDEIWRLRGEIEHFQIIDKNLEALDRPYSRLPSLKASGLVNLANENASNPMRLSYGIETELVNFDRDAGVKGWRFDAKPTLSLDFSQAGYYLRPTTSWRLTRYALAQTAPGAEQTPTRSLPAGAFDAGALLERTANLGGLKRITLEPRLLYLWTPYRDQNKLPIFDTAVPDLDFVQLFRSTSYVGADRVADANQASLGFTSQIFDSIGGRRLLSATLGKIFYFQTPQVRLPQEVSAKGHQSDLVAQLGVTAWSHWDISLGLQWNPQIAKQERSQVRLRYRPDSERALNLAYRFQRERIEQAELSGAWPINARWNAFGRTVYDLQEKTSLESFTGLEYKACCWRVRLVGRHFISNRTGERDTGIYLQLELNGLASVGSSADTFFEQAIRGYSSDSIKR